MKHLRNQRVVQTFDLGYEQLQIVEEPDRQIKVLFRGVWLRDSASPVARSNVRSAHRQPDERRFFMNARHRSALATSMFVAAAAVASAATPSDATDAHSLERGRYLVRITGCNDCHTQGFAESGGQVPESQWLTGGALGFRGPWGTTYAPNLRLYLARLSEDQWVQTARTLNTRPPMPWFSVRAMNEPDLRALYRYVRTLQPAGAPAPAFVPPGREPQGPAVRYPAPPGK